MLKWLKRVFNGFLALIFALPISARAQESRQPQNSSEEKPSRARFSKDALISSLKQMNRSPKAIKTICAMCYKMVVLPKDAQFQCNICGHATNYVRASDQGALVENLSNIKRSLAQMPYKISIDSTGLCSICGKGKDKAIFMRVSCFDCGEEFSWEVRNQKDINMLRWLYLKPPINEIDTTRLGLWGNTEDDIREGAEYIRDHVFCPVCREKIELK